MIKEHVFAHQDGKGLPITMLDKLNCRMDSVAKTNTREGIRSDQVILSHPTTIKLGTIT